MKPTLLLWLPMDDKNRATLNERYEVIQASTPQARETVLATPAAARVRVVLTNGSVGFTAAQMSALPALELIGVMGAGYENVDVDAAKQHGVAVANGAGANANAVADHAFALLLATVRSVVRMDAFCRSGGWRDNAGLLPGVSGKRLGILGLGAIGATIARRGLGFDMEVAYHNRRRVDDSPHTYFGSLVELASWADFLVAVTPGGPSTYHLITAEVLKALGPKGFLVNVGRGSVVDTAVLAQALRDGVIAGAGLDVYEGEPEPPAPLLSLTNVVLTPHVAGMSPESRQATIQRFLDNAERHFAGQPMISPL